jgi:hypothetical protein
MPIMVCKVQLRRLGWLAVAQTFREFLLVPMPLFKTMFLVNA